MKNVYQVIVANVGCMEYTSKKLALDCYNTYVTLSKKGQGRAANEDVTLIKNDVIMLEHFGTIEN